MTLISEQENLKILDKVLVLELAREAQAADNAKVL